MSAEQITALPTPRMLEIERKFGINGESILDILNRFHYLENQSLRDMEKALGVNRHTLSRWGRCLGFLPRSREEAWELKKTGPKPHLKEAQIISHRRLQYQRIVETFGNKPSARLRWLRSLGFTICEIGDRVGRNEKTITAWMRRLGIDTTRTSWTPERTAYIIYK